MSVLERYLSRVNQWLDKPVTSSGDEWEHVKLCYTRSYHPRRTADEIMDMRKAKAHGEG